MVGRWIRNFWSMSCVNFRVDWHVKTHRQWPLIFVRAKLNDVFVKLPKVVIGCIKDQIVWMCTTSFGLQSMCQVLKYALEEFLSGHEIITMHWVWESSIQSSILCTWYIGFMKINKIARDCSVTFEDTGVIIKHVFSERITLKSIDYQYTRRYISCVIYIRACICISLWSLQKNDHVL